MEMKLTIATLALVICSLVDVQAQNTDSNSLFIDVHILRPGSVTAADVAAAHSKDVAVQEKYGVSFQRYWVDEKNGTVYCLSSAPDSAHIAAVHNEAHGLLPQQVYQVVGGKAAATAAGRPYFIDIHNAGAGKIAASTVAGAHKKDVAIEKKYGVHFINYWVCEEKGWVFCLSQTNKPENILNTHKAAHGLLPAVIIPVVQGK
jgi:hypothetical protein